MSIPFNPQTVKQAALAYANRGWNIFPTHSIDATGCTCHKTTCTDHGKHPVPRHWQQAYTTDAMRISKWWAGDAQVLYNIAIATGKDSGLTVIDVDIKNNGLENWQDLRSKFDIPDTYTVRTGSGGLHLYFKYHPDVPTKTETYGPGIDTRNDNGYIIAPPSLHKSGAQYQVLCDLPLADFPQCLVNAKPTSKPKARRAQDMDGDYMSLEEAKALLDYVDNSSYTTWFNVGVILGRTFKLSDEAWALYQDWSDKDYQGARGPKRDATMQNAFYQVSQTPPQGANALSSKTLRYLAAKGGYRTSHTTDNLNSFCYLASENAYIYLPTGEKFVATSVDYCLPPVTDKGQFIKASKWIAENRRAMLFIKDGSLPNGLIDGYHYDSGQITPFDGFRVLNLFRHGFVAPAHYIASAEVPAGENPEYITAPTPLKFITSHVVKGFHYDPSDPTANSMGFTRIARHGFCAVDNTGGLLPNICLGEDWYNQRRAEAEATCKPFLDHLKRIFTNDPRDMDTFLNYMAFKMQNPSVKPRWGIVLAGDQGVGKDISITACWQSYGTQYINNISPVDLLSSFNDYMQCMLLRISEVADLGESNKWEFNEKAKVVISGQPDRIQINPKYGAKYWITSYNATILTTNHLEGGIYIPEGDRRYYVIKCASWHELNLTQEQKEKYFADLFKWFETKDVYGLSGYDHIAQYLFYLRDVRGFNVNMCPAPTMAKIETQSLGSMIPDYIDDGLLAYSDMLSQMGGLNKSASIYTHTSNPYLLGYDTEYRPFIIDVRMLRGIILKARPELEKELSPKRLSYWLNQSGYTRLLNEKGTGWIVQMNNAPRTKETLYYLPAPVPSKCISISLADYTIDKLRHMLSTELRQYVADYYYLDSLKA